MNPMMSRLEDSMKKNNDILDDINKLVFDKYFWFRLTFTHRTDCMLLWKLVWN